MQKSAELSIDLNGKTITGYTAFHIACEKGHSKIAEIFVQKSTELSIDLNVRTSHGYTAFHNACIQKQSKVIH